MIKYLLSFLLFICFFQNNVFGQQLPVYQHSFLIRSAYNPAETLNEANEISIYALRGNQYQKFNGGFVNNYANFSTPLENVNIGLGIDMASRSYGPMNQLSIGFAYAYRIVFNKYNSLVFGARLGFMEHRFNKGLVNIYQENDPTIDAIPVGRLLPNGNFGVTLHTKIGALEFSVPQLLSNRFLNTTTADIQTIALLPHLFSRYSFDWHVIKDKLDLTPIVSVRYLPGTIVQYETGLTAFFNKTIWVNANYRSDYSFSAGVGIRANDKWTVGYSYDRPIVNPYSFNASNHELVLGYTFQRGKATIPEPEWTQAKTETRTVKMDSISPVQDVTMAEEFLRTKLDIQKKRDSLLVLSKQKSKSKNSNYKSITVEVNMIDSLFESLITTVDEESNSSKNNKSKAEITEETKKRIEEEDKYLAEINKSNSSEIKIVRNKQPSDKYFVELSGDDSPNGYYLITGVFSTLQRAQNFRWNSTSDMSKIIINKKNNYFYVVHSYSESKTIKDLENTLKEYRSNNQKIWILDY